MLRRRRHSILLYPIIVVFIFVLYRTLTFILMLSRVKYCNNVTAAFSFNRICSLNSNNIKSLRGTNYTFAYESYTEHDHTKSPTRTNPYHYTYRIANKNACAENPDIYVIVLVHTSTDHFYQREVIRNTWSNISLFDANKMRLLFLLGKTETTDNQHLIELESNRFEDIVQGDFIDTYRNLTHKALFGFQWVLDHCRNATFILKIDDDVSVDIVRLINVLSTNYSTARRTIFCRVKLKDTDPIVRRGKFKISLTEYPMKYWPVTHCSGFFMLYTADIISDLYEAASRTPFLWIDDVYVPGFLAAAVGNISHSNPQDVTGLAQLTGVHLE